MGLFSKKKTTPTGMPYEEIDSIEKARIEAARGGLERIYIISPSLFGGSEGEDNVLYVPVGISATKDQIDLDIVKQIQEGHKCSFNCQPEYKGRSVVPSKIVISYTCAGSMSIKKTLYCW